MPLYQTLLLWAAFTTGDAPQWEQRLGSESFRVRVQARRDLHRSGRLPLCRCLMRSRDPEVARTSRLVAEDIRDEAKTSLAPFPNIDSAWVIEWLVKNDQAIKGRLERRYLDRYDIGLQEPLPWMGYRLACRDWCNDMIDDGIPVWLIRLRLYGMHQKDNANGFGLVKK